jgi:hypothetical protein
MGGQGMGAFHAVPHPGVNAPAGKKARSDYQENLMLRGCEAFFSLLKVAGRGIS